jgi:hypothetical protein
VIAPLLGAREGEMLTQCIQQMPCEDPESADESGR